jgi:hypothetical protein
MSFSGTLYQQSNHIHKTLILSQVKLNGKALTDINVKSCATDTYIFTTMSANMNL